MYEPKRELIEEKAGELLDKWLYENNCEGLIDAVITNIHLVKALLGASLDDLADARTDLLTACEKYAKSYKDFEEEARDYLIGQVGYVKRTDVDDFKFIHHDTRY